MTAYHPPRGEIWYYSFKNREVELCEGVIARVLQTVGIVQGKENKRVTVQIISNIPDSNKIIKEYYVWIDPEYSQNKGFDKLSEEDAEILALEEVKQRFEENGRETPIEDGAYLSDGEVVIVDPMSFIHPLEAEANE